MQVLSGDDTFGNALLRSARRFRTRGTATDGEPFPASSSCRPDSWIPTFALDRQATWQKLADDGHWPACARPLHGIARDTARRIQVGRAAAGRHRSRGRAAQASRRAARQRPTNQFKGKTVLVVGQARGSRPKATHRRGGTRVSRCGRRGRWPHDARQARACPACARGGSIASMAACRRKADAFPAYLELLSEGLDASAAAVSPMRRRRASRSVDAHRDPPLDRPACRLPASRRNPRAKLLAARGAPVDAVARSGACRPRNQRDQRRPHVRAPAADARTLRIVASDRNRASRRQAARRRDERVARCRSVPGRSRRRIRYSSTPASIATIRCSCRVRRRRSSSDSAQKGKLRRRRTRARGVPGGHWLVAASDREARRGAPADVRNRVDDHRQRRGRHRGRGRRRMLIAQGVHEANKRMAENRLAGRVPICTSSSCISIARARVWRALQVQAAAAHRGVRGRRDRATGARGAAARARLGLSRRRLRFHVRA